MEWGWYPPYPAGLPARGGWVAVGVNGRGPVGPVPGVGWEVKLAPEAGRGNAVGG